MRRHLALALAGALSLTAIAAGEVNVDHACYDAEAEAMAYPEQQVWFHEGDAKVGNQSAAAPWDTTEPTTSVQGGAGAMTLNAGTATLAEGTPAEHFAVFAGTFEGCIDTMQLEVYSFDPTNRAGTGGADPACLPDCVPAAASATMDVGLVIEVDGVEVYRGGPIEITTDLANEGFGPNRNTVAVNLASTIDLYAGYDMLQADGEHNVTVSIRNWYVNTGHGAFLWDTTEVPSNLTFNGEIPEGTATFGG